MDRRRLGSYRCVRQVRGDRVGLKLVLFSDRVEWALDNRLTVAEYIEAHGRVPETSELRGVIPADDVRGVSVVVDPVSQAAGRIQFEVVPEPWTLVMGLASIKRFRSQVEQIASARHLGDP